jgi:pimeloyl-ACP methyl ester carboxylesterase
MIDRIEIDFDVTSSLPSDFTRGSIITISTWCFLPDDLSTLGPRPTTITLLSGGTYDKRYHHAVIPGHPGYSAAEHLASLGNIVLLVDHLGVGDSSRPPNPKASDARMVARANHAAVTEFHARLAAGTLTPRLGAMADFVRIGGGHSMGAMQTIVQQAEHATYDGVMVIGYTAEGVHFTRNGKKIAAATTIPTGEQPDYWLSDRSALREGFHWEDVPEDVVAYDNSIQVETPTKIGRDSLRTRVVADEAGRIEVPVYFCVSERDVSPDPHAEPAFFRASADVTMHILPRAAHCQSFAGTRHQMWNRMHQWARWVASDDARHHRRL